VDGDRVDLRGAVGELMGAVSQLGRVGDPRQLAAAEAVLSGARRSLYLILAGELPSEGGDEQPAPGGEDATPAS